MTARAAGARQAVADRQEARGPEAGGRQAPLVAPHGVGVAQRTLDVYLVEDNVLVRESLIAALEELAPIRIVGSAADESVAVRWLDEARMNCDLVIVDIFLRSGSGLGVIAAGRRRRPEAALVVLSNYATDEMRARCLAAGADHVYDKSRDIDVLVAFCISLAHRGEPH